MEGIFFDQYQTFRCIGPDCPCTCCGGNWTIEIDADSERFYRSCRGSFGAYLNKNIVRTADGAHFRLTRAGNCTMLDEGGWCRIQTNYGAEHLCETCRLFPRLTAQRDKTLFLYLSLSCPEAARELLRRREPLRVLRRDVELPVKASDPELAELRHLTLLTAMDLLQDRGVAIRQRQRLLLLLSRTVQAALDEGNREEIKKLLSLFSQPSEYRALAAESGGTDVASKVAFLRKLSGLFLTERRERRLPELFRAAVDDLQAPDADLPAFAACLAGADSDEQERGMENLLLGLLPGKYVSAFADGDLFRQAIYVLALAQLYRVFAAVEQAAGVHDGDEMRGAAIVAYIDRYFEHSDAGVRTRFARLIDEQGLTDLGFLFRLIS